MLNNHQHINYTLADIEQYLQGKMTNAEMNAFEKAALQDPFLADAIEGFELANTTKASQAIEFTTQQIEHNNIYQPNANIGLPEIEAYIENNLNGRQRNSFEKATLKEPFLADATDGFAMADLSLAKKYLQEIEEKIVAEKKETSKVIPLTSHTKNQWLRIAAAILILVGVGSTIWLVNKQTPIVENPIAVVQPEVKKPTPITETTIPSSSKTVLPTLDKPITSASTPVVNDAVAKNNDVEKEQPSIVTMEAVKEDVSINSNVQKALENKVSGVQTQYATAKKQENDTRELAAKSSVTNNANDSRNYLQPNNNNTNTNNYSNATNQLRGRIANTNGEPIVGATVTVKDRSSNNNYTAVTNQLGDFKVNVADTTAIAAIESVGYQQQQINLSANRANNIILNGTDNNLNDVVVIGYGSQAKKTLAGSSTANKKDMVSKSPTPVGGWASFNDYLHKQIAELLTVMKLNNEDTSTIVVEFKVDKLGNPYNINTTGSNNNSLTKKAKEIIQNGPKWTTDAKTKKVKVLMPL